MSRVVLKAALRGNFSKRQHTERNGKMYSKKKMDCWKLHVYVCVCVCVGCTPCFFYADTCSANGKRVEWFEELVPATCFITTVHSPHDDDVLLKEAEKKKLPAQPHSSLPFFPPPRGKCLPNGRKRATGGDFFWEVVKGVMWSLCRFCAFCAHMFVCHCECVCVCGWVSVFLVYCWVHMW